MTFRLTGRLSEGRLEYPNGCPVVLWDPGTVTSPDKANLTLGSLPVAPPVVLAPMAGITNVAFRQLCREHGAGIYVCEMVMTRALVERNEKTLRMVTFAGDEKPRSLQLYGVDPVTVRKAICTVQRLPL